MLETFVGHSGGMFGNLCQKLPETKKKILSIIIYVFFIQCICSLQPSKLGLSGAQSYRPDFSKGIYLLQAGKSLAIKHAQTEAVEQEAGVVVWPGSGAALYLMEGAGSLSKWKKISQRLITATQ